MFALFRDTSYRCTELSLEVIASSVVANRRWHQWFIDLPVVNSQSIQEGRDRILTPPFLPLFFSPSKFVQHHHYHLTTTIKNQWFVDFFKIIKKRKKEGRISFDWSGNNATIKTFFHLFFCFERKVLDGLENVRELTGPGPMVLDCRIVETHRERERCDLSSSSPSLLLTFFMHERTPLMNWSPSECISWSNLGCYEEKNVATWQKRNMIGRCIRYANFQIERPEIVWCLERVLPIRVSGSVVVW